MDKTTGLYYFWSLFDWPALDEMGDYDDKDKEDLNITDRYIMYEVQTGDYTGPVALTASLYHRSSSYETLARKAEQIEQYIGNGKLITLDDGYLWVKRRNPFAQHMESENRDWRRIVLNIVADFLTAY